MLRKSDRVTAVIQYLFILKEWGVTNLTFEFKRDVKDYGKTSKAQ